MYTFEFNFLYYFIAFCKIDIFSNKLSYSIIYTYIHYTFIHSDIRTHFIFFRLHLGQSKKVYINEIVLKYLYTNVQ